MSDYIKRDDAIEAIREIYDNAWDAVDADDMFRDGLLEARDAVMLVPSADVVEVRHGHWSESVALLGKSICSNCQLYWIDTDSQYDFNYCPRCGARMDGNEHE